MKNFFLTLIIILAYLYYGIGQDIDLEKTYEITGKAKRGYLAKAEFDLKSGNYILTYITKSSPSTKTAKFETYRFDKDFNFLNLDQMEVEIEKAKTIYPWWNFRGEQYSVEGVSVESLALNAPYLRKYIITYSYDWTLLDYSSKIKNLGKFFDIGVELRSEEGGHYYCFSSVDDVTNGNLFILAGLQNNKDELGYMKNLHLLKINNDLDVVKNLEVKFEYPQKCVTSKTIYDENNNIIEFLYLFAPARNEFVSLKRGNTPDPQINRYTFLRVNPKLEILERLTINSPANFWRVDDIISPIGKNDYYLYGPSAPEKDKYYDQLLLQTPKIKAFQIAKISNHQLDYLTETTIDEFNAKLKLPPSQGKTPAYNGRNFNLWDAQILNNGELFITGQTNGGIIYLKGGKSDFTYKDFLGFQFDSKGKLKAQYGIDAKTNSHMAPQVLLESQSGKSLYWLLQEVKGLKGEGIGFQIMGMPQFSALLNKRLLTYPRLGKIDLNTGTISDIVLYGEENYFLDNNYPIISIPSENKLVLFGANKAGNIIWFVRIRMD